MKTAVIFFISIVCSIVLPLQGSAQDQSTRLSFQLYNLPLRSALDSLMKWYPEFIVYLDKDVEGKMVTAVCLDCSFDRALNLVLDDSSLRWIRLGNQVILQKYEARSEPWSTAVSGTITDSVTGEWIVGASVLLQDSVDQLSTSVGRWCPTNSYGFFSLPRIPLGSYVLVVRAMGYETVKKTIDMTVDGSTQFNLGLVEKNIILKEVTVEGYRTAFTSTEGISRGIYVRSVPSDQNQYLLDGGRIYNPTHFGGVLSTFNSAALNGIQIVLGGPPPFYGGRVGGIVDLSMRDGTQQGVTGSLGIGSLGSKFSLEGPLTNTTTVLFTGRRAYPDVAMKYLKPGISPNQLGFTELIAKLRHRLSGSSQISMNGYYGRDTYNNEVQGENEQLRNNFSWENGMLNLRWIGIVSPSLFLYSSAVYSRYDFNLQHTFTGDFHLSSNAPLSSDYAIEDFSFRAHVESYYDEEHTVRAGVELIHHRVNGSLSEFSTQIGPFRFHNYTSWETSVYLQDRWKILPRVIAELGARATSFVGDEGSFSAVDPRFSLLGFLSEQARVYCSLSAINQFIHPYRNSGIFLFYPTVFWYPSTDKVQPTTTLQATLGFERDIMDGDFLLSAESYYRIIHNLHEFVVDTLAAALQEFDNTLLLGSGRTYGVVCLFQKRTGDLTGSISYNLCWSKEKFSEINEGREFPTPFDRRHELLLAVRFTLSGNWDVGAMSVLTFGESSSLTQKIVDKKVLLTEYPPQSGNLAYNELIDVNGHRLHGFQRLELNVIRHFTLGGLPCQFSIRLLNSYGILDPFEWKLQPHNIDLAKWSAVLREQKLFPLYPAAEFTVRF